MKKKFSLEIKEPCPENFDKMIPNSNGSFCSTCVKNVIDLSTKTNSEIGRFIAQNKNNNSICARLKTSQLQEEFEINELSKTTNLKYAVAVAASILLTSNVAGQEKEPVKTEVGCAKPNPHIVGKIAYSQSIEKIISFTLKGKIWERDTKKPLSEKKYPNLYLYITGSKSSVRIDPKTGKYEMPIMINEKNTEIYITISNDDFTFSKTMKIDLSKIKNEELILNISIDSEKEMQNYKIMGGLGINYIDNKKIKLI